VSSEAISQVIWNIYALRTTVWQTWCVKGLTPVASM